LPKVTTTRRCNDVDIDSIGTPHTTESQQEEQVTTSHSRCNDVEIERIGTPHETVSQQAEQVRIDTGERATQRDDRSRRKIVSTELRVEPERFQLQSRTTNEPQYQFGDPSYTTTAPRWQSTIDMKKLSTEQRIFKKEGDSRVRSVKSYRQVKSPPGGGLLRHAPTSLPKVDRPVCRERNHEAD
jgi:hypothetical protein